MEISCGTLTWRERDGKIEVLLIKQWPNSNNWGIPKGHVNDDESYESCAIRETFEETGMGVVIKQRLADITYRLKNRNMKTVIAYLAIPMNPSGSLSINHHDCEVAAAEWFPIDNLPKIHDSQASLVNEAIQCIVRNS